MAGISKKMKFSIPQLVPCQLLREKDAKCWHLLVKEAVLFPPELMHVLLPIHNLQREIHWDFGILCSPVEYDGTIPG